MVKSIFYPSALIVSPVRTTIILPQPSTQIRSRIPRIPLPLTPRPILTPTEIPKPLIRPQTRRQILHPRPPRTLLASQRENKLLPLRKE